jgi:exonuclease SbcD
VVKQGEEIPEEPADEKPILHVGGAQMIFTENIPSQIQYTALGHLHRKQKIAEAPCPVYYSGSPLSYSFAEASQNKYVILVEAEPGKTVQLQEIELTASKKLMRKRAEGMDEAIQFLKENPECLVELTIVTDTFLTAADRKLLGSCHDGIVTIIPEVKDGAGMSSGKGKNIDLTKTMEELFGEYFRQAKGQAPNEDLMALFKEMLAQDEEN